MHALNFAKLTLFFYLLAAITLQLHAAPIRVPLERYKNGYDKSQHQGHYPFISYITFRNICDHVIEDRTEWFDPTEVKPGDTIYLNIWYLDWFVKEVHDQIPHPYILVTCDVGAWLPHVEFKKLLYDPKLAAWFCRNMIFSYHPKLIQTPMGQDLGLFILDNPKMTFYLLDVFLNKPFMKKHLLYMCHYPRKHGDRDKIVKQFEHEPFCFTRNHSNEEFIAIPNQVFYKDLSESTFVLSPLGFETDCVRTWEAMALDCIPIVEHTFLDPSYDRLPVVKVHSWDEITPSFLEKKLEELKDRKSDEAYFDYWFRLVRQQQKKIRAGDTAYAKLEETYFTNQDVKDFFSIINRKKMTYRPIFYKGLLCALRRMQIADQHGADVYLFDPYLDQEVLQNLEAYVLDPVALGGRQKVELFAKESAFFEEAACNAAGIFFLDLTYYRTSLFVNFATSIINDGNFRHSLNKDLKELYSKLKTKTLLIGNMVTDEYVREVLEMFAEDYELTIEQHGSFWYLIKN